MRSCLLMVLLGLLVSGCEGERVDLRDQQTAGFPSSSGTASVIRDQGPRSTCITFGATAVLEAEYNRAGYGELDLSEQFLNHFGKMNWLHPYWDRDIAPNGAGYTENQVGLFGGGGAVGYLVALGGQTRTVEDSLARYKSSFPYRDGDTDVWTAPSWQLQEKANDANLWPLIFPYAARRPERTFGAAEVQLLCDDTGLFSEVACSSLPIEAFEDVLREGHAIAIDTRLIMRREAVWTFDEDQADMGAHAMALVGFDKTDALNPYFIVKNSWGPTSGGDDGDCGEDGFTCVDYEFVRRNVYTAGYVRSVSPPQPWPELGLIGRWSGRVAGETGLLDLYHLPGTFQETLDTFTRYLGLPDQVDRRAGTWKREDGSLARLNGAFAGREARLELSPGAPNLRWGDHGTDGLRLSVLEGEPWAVAGLYNRPGGAVEAAYGLADFDGGQLVPAYRSPLPVTTDSWFGRWEVRVGAEKWTLSILDRDDFDVPAGYAGLTARWGRNGYPSIDTQVLVSLANPSVAKASVQRPGWTSSSSDPQWVPVILAHDTEEAIFTGHSFLEPAAGTNVGVLARRIGSPMIPRILTPLHASVHQAHVSTRFEGVAHGAVSYEWVSSIDGPIGSSASFNTTALSRGPNVITLTVRNAEGQRDSTEVYLDVQNTAPQVTWLEPNPEGPLCADTPLTYRAAVSDPNELIAEEDISWHVDDGASVASGSSATLTLPEGTHSVRVVASDPWTTGSDQRELTFQTCTQAPPTAAITSPEADVLVQDNRYEYTGYDEARGLWYTSLQLQGTGSDPEDGTLTGSSLQWSTDQTSLQPAALGGGNSRNVWLYSDQSCGGIVHTITLTVTDSGGQRSTATRRILIWTLC